MQNKVVSSGRWERGGEIKRESVWERANDGRKRERARDWQAYYQIYPSLSESVK